MNLNGMTPIQMHRLALKLKPIFIGRLFIIESLQHPGFHYDNGQFVKILESEEGITSEFISDFAKNYSREIFISNEDFNLLSSKLKEELTKLTRSLSIGDIKKNAIKHSNLLSMQMNSLYEDPYNDSLLTNQFQNSKNLSTLLLANKNIHKPVFENIKNSNYHYILTQPLLSSILLLSFIQSLKLFNEKEIEGLFLTSYFKDVGLSFIPREKFEQAHLSKFDKQFFSRHAENSMAILDGRVPLNTTQLNIIKNHHFLNYKIQALIKDGNSKDDLEFLTGIESTLISSFDILIAMTANRPYRKGITTFSALELLKKVIAEEYPHEFKALILFLRNFLTK